jgi:hypothetical protein
MITETAKDVLVVIYCFENDIDLESLLEESKEAFLRFADVKDPESWIL